MNKKITRRIVKFVGKIADDKKAKDILLLDLKRISSICDFFVILSGTSKAHLQALSDNIQEKLREKEIKPHHIEGTKESGWILLDYGNMIIHIFTEQERRYYNLERLWGDAKVI